MISMLPNPLATALCEICPYSIGLIVKYIICFSCTFLAVSPYVPLLLGTYQVDEPMLFNSLKIVFYFGDVWLYRAELVNITTSVPQGSFFFK